MIADGYMPPVLALVALSPPHVGLLPVRTWTALRGLLDPWLFLWQSAKRLPGAALALLRADLGLRGGPPAALLPGPPARCLVRPVLGDRGGWAVSDFWVQQGTEWLVLALPEGRATDGRVVGTPLSPAVGGTVLEIGAGLGGEKPENREREGERDHARLRRRAQQGPHASLRRRVEAAGLRAVYRIAPVGIEDLGDAEKWGRYDEGDEGAGIEKGSVDCIVSTLCLCSIPNPERNVRELYGCLREGGGWYVYEHVRCDYGWYMRAYQRVLNFFWPVFVGGCQLCRPTIEWLREAGPWSDIDVGQPPHEE
ncbi:hypothetical protein DL771_003957 [Monosporascus sp. 5C6A]|nr:hypothetical protein DL771_003957 [Monosporascus sp. 5C6A]